MTSLPGSWAAVPPPSDIISYFTESMPFYRHFWHGPTGALHFGMRDGAADDHFAALLHTNRVLADAADVRPGSRVLDAGCGIGGSALWLAEHRGAEVVGVTLCEAQAQAATARAAGTPWAARVAFRRADYAATGLPAGSVDVVWALESTCYAADKRPVLAEARRVLRPGGRVVIADGFRARRPVGALEQRLYAGFHAGLVLPELDTVDAWTAGLRDAGFTSVRADRHSAAVEASARRLFRRCLGTYPLAMLARGLGLVSAQMLANSRAGIAAWPLLRRGVLEYALLVGRVPG